MLLGNPGISIEPVKPGSSVRIRNGGRKVSSTMKRLSFLSFCSPHVPSSCDCGELVAKDLLSSKETFDSSI
ncbi:hypothetical protein V6N13_091083 [Hibiscus sabdariffa]